MQLIRTILLIVITIVLVAFVAINWTPVDVNFWPLDNGNYLHVKWPVGLIVLVAMALGYLPMWLLHKGARWNYNRRLNALENSVKAATAGNPAMIATSTQLEAAAEEPPVNPL